MIVENDGTSKRLALYTEIPFTWGIWDSRNHACLNQDFYRNKVKRVDDFGVPYQVRIVSGCRNYSV